VTEQVCVGMFRPRWDSMPVGKGYVQCACGTMIQTQVGLRDHWQLGHFDTPVYQDADEKEEGAK
jgi:hypothetical protein